jgi:hypothetical protein
MKIYPSLLFFLATLMGNAILADMPYCDEQVTEIDIGQSSALGFSGTDLVEIANQDHRLRWIWDYKVGTTWLHLTATSFADKARYIHSVPVYSDDGPDIIILCPDRLEVDAWIRFATDDGAFDETWFVTLYDTDGTDCIGETEEACPAPGSEANFDHGFDHESIDGHFYSDIEAPEEDLDFYAHGAFRHESAQVDVIGQAYVCEHDYCYSYYVHGGHTP